MPVIQLTGMPLLLSDCRSMQHLTGSLVDAVKPIVLYRISVVIPFLVPKYPFSAISLLVLIFSIFIFVDEPVLSTNIKKDGSVTCTFVVVPIIDASLAGTM
jgi:hypothetical protein